MSEMYVGPLLSFFKIHLFSELTVNLQGLSDPAHFTSASLAYINQRQ